MKRLLSFFLLAIILNAPSAIAADSYVVNNGQNQDITEHATCRNVANATGQNIMVPTKTNNEWSTGGNSFVENPPAGVTISACGPSSPTGCPNIGDVCSDGSVYAGLSPDGNVPMYTTPADEAGTYAWKTSTSVTAGTGSLTDGVANTDAMAAASLAAHPAAQACRTRGASWYLPAKDELNVLYVNRAAIGGFDTTVNSTYWSSSNSTFNTQNAQSHRFSDGFQSGLLTKTLPYRVRCVRKEVPPCGGVEVGGYCWYASASGQSCDDACTAAGSTCNLTGTRDYTGSNGTVPNCESVLAALGYTTGSFLDNATWGSNPIGCAYDDTFTFFRTRQTANTTTCSASAMGAVRTCACND